MSLRLLTYLRVKLDDVDNISTVLTDWRVPSSPARSISILFDLEV